jgi:hypothetical protein
MPDGMAFFERSSPVDSINDVDSQGDAVIYHQHRPSK